MADNGIGKFAEKLKEIIDKPPYLIFLFIGAVLVFVSIVSDRYFWQVWIFFLYSVVGTIWRYSEKDTRNNVLKEDEHKKTSIVIYHLFNIILLTVLITLLFYEHFR